MHSGEPPSGSQRGRNQWLSWCVSVWRGDQGKEISARSLTPIVMRIILVALAALGAAGCGYIGEPLYPLLNIPKQKAKTQPKNAPDPAPNPTGADAYHPRQRIYTDPVHPTHPRQTLINSAAPAEAPKFVPPLPNVVQVAAAPAPPRPHIEISEKTLAKLRPKEVKKAATTDSPTPDLPNMEQRTAQLSLVSATVAPVRPKLEIDAGSAPRAAERTQAGENVSAPEVAPAMSASNGAASTFIALSASPAPPAPVIPSPQGNLAARVAISHEGKQPGASSGTGAAGGASSSGSGGGSGNILE